MGYKKIGSRQMRIQRTTNSSSKVKLFCCELPCFCIQLLLVTDNERMESGICPGCPQSKAGCMPKLQAA